MKEKELEKLKKDAQHLQNKQNAIDNLLRLNIQPCNCKDTVCVINNLQQILNQSLTRLTFSFLWRRKTTYCQYLEET
jgi:hypothetical protein